MANLFKRIYIKATQQGLELSSGSVLSSQDDYLIHTLETNLKTTARTISQNEPPFTAVINTLDSGSFWALATDIDFPIVSDMITDVTTLSGVEKSASFWGLSSWDGISLL